MTSMKSASQMLNAYSFQEGFLAGIRIDRSAGTAVLEFNAVPLRSGHPGFDQKRLAENQKRGALYSNEDARNVDLHCSGCTFHSVSWDPLGRSNQTEKEFDLNNSVDKFQVAESGAGSQTIELEAEDIRLVMTCTRVELSETRISDG